MSSKINLAEYWRCSGEYRTSGLERLDFVRCRLKPGPAALGRDRGLNRADARRKRMRNGSRASASVVYELLSICARSSAIEPNLTVPCGSLASIDPSA